MGLTERHWFEDEEPELTENQLEDILWENNKIFERGYQKGFFDGKSAAPTVGGWISVKDRLPENGQQVVAISVEGFCEVVNFEVRTGRWVGMEGWYPTDRITHWMPLPEPPEVTE